MLGHPKAEKEFTQKTPVSYKVSPKHYIQGPNQIDLLAGFRLMYVYADIVKPSIVGNAYVPILEQVVPHFDKNGQFAIEISNPNFVELTDSITSVRELTISVTDSLGRDLSYDDQSLTPKAKLQLIS